MDVQGDTTRNEHKRGTTDSNAGFHKDHGETIGLELVCDEEIRRAYTGKSVEDGYNRETEESKTETSWE